MKPKPKPNISDDIKLAKYLITYSGTEVPATKWRDEAFVMHYLAAH